MHAVIIGASGGIGGALADALEARGDDITRLARRDGGIDLTDETSIAAAAARLASGPPIDQLVVASGILNGAAAAPEKSLAALSAGGLAEYFAVNAIGPALALKHLAPLLPRDSRAVVAMLSARVGSISDNRLGGWYGYRASKAALNQIVRTAAIELARTRPQAICVALHPGTVDTALSRPFQRGVAPGRLFTSADSAARLIGVIDALTAADSGTIVDFAGMPIAP